MRSGNAVIFDKMQFPGVGGTAGVGGGGSEMHHPRQWFPDERDGLISWLRAEFAAANAIIDSLCHHLRAVGDPGEYDVVIGSIQQRRCGWNYVLHMQQYFPVAEVMVALQQVAWRRQQRSVDQVKVGGKDFKRGVYGVGRRHGQRVEIANGVNSGSVDNQNHDANSLSTVSRGKAGETTGKGEVAKPCNEAARSNNEALPATEDNADASSNVGELNSVKSSRNSERAIQGQTESIAEGKGGTALSSTGSSNLSAEGSSHSISDEIVKESLAISPKTFTVLEPCDEKMVNVVDGMTAYYKLLDESKVSELVALVNDIRAAGRRGQFQGKTFVVSKRPAKGHGRETIQFGVAISDAFGEDDNASGTYKDKKVEPIPGLLQDVIDSIGSSQVMTVKPDSCIIDIFNEGDHSQPYSWPQWYGRPIFVLFLSECNVTFGKDIRPDYAGDYKGSLSLSLPPGSLLVLQGRSADLAKRAIPSIHKQRIVITFTKSQPRRALPSDSHRPNSSAFQNSNRGPPPSWSPNHIRPKHYPPMPTTAVLAAPPTRPQLPLANTIPPMFIATPVPSAIPFPSPVPIPPGAPGWAATSSMYPPPHVSIHAPGTGVFLPPSGSGSENLLPSQMPIGAPVSNSMSEPKGEGTMAKANGNGSVSSNGKPGNSDVAEPGGGGEKETTRR